MRMINLPLMLALFFVVTMSACKGDGEKEEAKDKDIKDEAPNKSDEEATVAEKANVDLPGNVKDVQKKTEEVPARSALDKLTEKAPKKPKKLPEPSVALPDFKNMENTQERKKAFIEFMKPIIKSENAKILEDRYLIARIYKGVQKGKDLSEKDEQWLKQKAETYRVDNTNFPSDESFRDLLIHVDIIPKDLAIAQAINESAWGTSRFARVGNNMFGQWCFKAGCGVVPAQRKEGATHEVAVFPTVAGSVESYMHHVNSHPAYKQLRVLRYQQRLEGNEPDGHTIALGLKKYSGIGMKYVNILRSMMKKNAELIEG